MDINSEYPLVSVIILNYNGGEFLSRCVSSVLKSDYPAFEVLLVDNASTDQSIKLVKETFDDDRLKVITLAKNLGFAEGNNAGVRAARGDVIVFLNNDTEVEPSWLNEIRKVMNSDSNIAACACKLLLFNDRKRLDNAGGTIDCYGFPHGRGDLVEDDGRFDKIEEIFIAKGAAMAVKRQVLEEVEIFDPLYFAFYEENDLCWRIWLRGYKIVFVPKAIVYHVGAMTYTKYRKMMAYLAAFHAAKNHISTLLKNYEFINLVKYIPPALLLRIGKSLLHIKNGELQMALAEMRGLLWCLKNFKHILFMRMKVQRRIRKVSDAMLLKYFARPSLLDLYRKFYDLTRIKIE